MKLREIDIHAKIKVRVFKRNRWRIKSGIIKTTLGKIIFNESIPQDLGFVDRNMPEK